MADEGQRQIRRFPVSPTAVPIGGGMTAEELKVHQGLQRLTRADLQPMPERAPSELIAPTTSSEAQRLAVPAAANPFATPLGPRHAYFAIRGLIERASTAQGRAVTNALKNPPRGLDPEQVSRMRASDAREHAMLDLLKPHLEWQKMIYSRITGQQHG